MNKIHNPFRIKARRELFNKAVTAYHRGTFLYPDGTENRGGSHRCYFWNGYNGAVMAPDDSLGYVFYRAGQECRKALSDFD